MTSRVLLDANINTSFLIDPAPYGRRRREVVDLYISNYLARSE